MKESIVSIAILVSVYGCAFKPNSEQAKNVEKPLTKKHIGFVPENLKISEGSTNYVLIDVMELPRSDYQLDLSKAAKGAIEYQYSYPSFTDSQCAGLGYNVAYEGRRKTITTAVKVVVYVNQKAVTKSNLVVSNIETVQIAVYGEYGPVSDYVDSGNLPNEFVKTFQPSNKCHYMCPTARVTPVRPLIFVPGKINCLFWIWGQDADHKPTSQQTSDFLFDPRQFEVAVNGRDYYLNEYAACDAVRSNSDLEQYYRAATDGSCAYGSTKQMMREWYYVEQKIPYKAPVYTISNFTEIIKPTSTTQVDSIADRAVHLLKDWTE